MKRLIQEFLLITYLTVIGVSLTGCATSDPASDRISYTGQFGETNVDLDIALPKDTRGKAIVIEGHTVAKDLENTSDIVDAGASVPSDNSGSTASMINDIRGYANSSPVLTNEFQGFRMAMVDVSQSNNPEVISLVADLNKAISEHNTQLASELAGQLMKAVVAGLNPAKD